MFEMNPFKMDFFLWDWFVSNIVLWDGQVSGPLCINIRISQDANFLHKEYSSYKVRYTTVFFRSSSYFIYILHM